MLETQKANGLGKVTRHFGVPQKIFCKRCGTGLLYLPIQTELNYLSGSCLSYFDCRAKDGLRKDPPKVGGSSDKKYLWRRGWPARG
ncbi:MAG: hypothetical protein UV57_C0009G0001 [Parcubacteria group bacterium GW2011_GWD2_43_10]|nr:MAG: hypothetical protein UV57_C0009G0001 [Parcubacteria group bacterium GW2011_GWD2_43_10]